ncbi:MAG: protein kinase [bacterium]
MLFQNLWLREAIDTVARVSAAHHALHRAGIINCDLKPQNILRRPNGEVRVIDLGVVRLINERAARAGCLPGTTPYFSPEQLVGEFWDQRRDIHVLGCLLIEFIRGTHPFLVLGTQLETLRRIKEDETEPLRTTQVLRSFSATEEGMLHSQAMQLLRTLNPILLKMTAHNPDNRFSGVDEYLCSLVKAREIARQLDANRVYARD